MLPAAPPPGLLMGLLARWLLRVGIFLVGATLGLVCPCSSHSIFCLLLRQAQPAAASAQGVAILLMATPLQDVKTFKS